MRDSSGEVRWGYERAIDLVRESERKISELVNALLLGNSFLVAAFAVILGQPVRSVVHYTIGAVGLIFCILLWFGIQNAWDLYKKRWFDLWTLHQKQQGHIPFSSPFITELNEKPWVEGQGVRFLLGASSIYRLWLPLLFFSMWAILLAFAIN